MLCMKKEMYKYTVCACLMLLTAYIFTGCSQFINSPLIGKSTDEKIIMCLEDTYPEHQFHVVETFDKEKDEGMYSDENGVEFRVGDTITYQSTYHFGCEDEYLYELLNQQNYIEKIESIVQKYNLELDESRELLCISVQVDDAMDTIEVASMIKEILNSVEIPVVIYPPEQGFSTGEVNYYSRPEWGMLYCELYDVSLGVTSGTPFYFEHKTESVQTLAEQIDQEIIETKEYFATKEENSKSEDINTQGTTVKTDFGMYTLQEGWEKKEAYSTDELYLYAQDSVEMKDGTSYFMISCRTNPYPEEQHKQFNQSILKQLLENENIPSDTSINATGYTTDKNNRVYSYEIKLNDDEIMRMHYIMGEKRHCLIQEINYNGSADCSDVVKEVINSFVWGK